MILIRLLPHTLARDPRFSSPPSSSVLLDQCREAQGKGCQPQGSGGLLSNLIKVFLYLREKCLGVFSCPAQQRRMKDWEGHRITLLHSWNVGSKLYFFTVVVCCFFFFHPCSHLPFAVTANLPAVPRSHVADLLPLPLLKEETASFGLRC